MTTSGYTRLPPSDFKHISSCGVTLRTQQTEIPNTEFEVFENETWKKPRNCQEKLNEIASKINAQTLIWIPIKAQETVRYVQIILEPNTQKYTELRIPDPENFKNLKEALITIALRAQFELTIFNHGFSTRSNICCFPLKTQTHGHLIKFEELSCQSQAPDFFLI